MVLAVLVGVLEVSDLRRHFIGLRAVNAGTTNKVKRAAQLMRGPFCCLGFGRLRLSVSLPAANGPTQTGIMLPDPPASVVEIASVLHILEQLRAAGFPAEALSGQLAGGPRIERGEIGHPAEVGRGFLARD